MSLKLVELQIALPKTFEAGKIAEQTQHQSQIAQSHAASETAKEAEKRRKQVVKNEQKGNSTIAKEDPSQKQFYTDMKNQEGATDSEEAVVALHPYKGTTIDFSG